MAGVRTVVQSGIARDADRDVVNWFDGTPHQWSRAQADFYAAKSAGAGAAPLHIRITSFLFR